MFTDYADHIFGFLGLFLIIFAWQLNERRNILLCHIAAFSLFSLELFIIGAVTGAVMMIFGALRVTTAMFVKNKYVMLAFIFAVVSAGAHLATHWHDALAVVASVHGIFVFFSQTVHGMRILAPFGTALWAIHNAMVGAWGQLLADIFILISMLVGFLRHRGDDLEEIEEITIHDIS